MSFWPWMWFDNLVLDIVCTTIVSYIIAVLYWKMALISAPFAYRIGHSPEKALPPNQVVEYALLGLVTWPFLLVGYLVKTVAILATLFLRLLFAPITSQHKKLSHVGNRLLAANDQLDTRLD